MWGYSATSWACSSTWPMRMPRIPLQAPTIDVSVVDLTVEQDLPSSRTQHTLTLLCQSTKYPLEEVAKSIVLCSHLGKRSGEEIEKFSMAPLATVVEGKLGWPMQPMMNIASYEVMAARADPAHGRIILLGTWASTSGRRARARMLMATSSGLIPRIKEFHASLAKMADIYYSAAFGTCNAPVACRLPLGQLSMHGEELAVGLTRH